jgi:hypothetical protein
MVLMGKKQLNIEVGLYILAFLLALGLRFLNLGSTPLSNDEAGWALQALEIVRGSTVEIGPQPGYVTLTGTLFFILGDSNALARFIPAIMGSMLVWLPFLFSPLLQGSFQLRLAGCLMAFGLAVDPGLVALARTAGSPIPALSFGLLAIGLTFRRKYILAGILAGLSLLFGPALILGGLGLALAWGAGKLLDNAGKLQPLPDQRSDDESDQPPPKPIRTGFIAALAVLLLIGTLFGQVPQGLSAFARTLPDYLEGWLTLSGVPLLRLPVALLVYETLVVVFGIIGAGRGWLARIEDDPAKAISQRLSLWGLTSLVMALVYPAHQVGDLCWMLVPLWGLAALEISRYTAVGERSSIKLVASGQAMMIFLVLGLSWLNLLGITRNPAEAAIFWLVIGGLLLMGLIVTLLIALGWSRRIWGWYGDFCCAGVMDDLCPVGSKPIALQQCPRAVVQNPFNCSGWRINGYPNGFFLLEYGSAK